LGKIGHGAFIDYDQSQGWIKRPPWGNEIGPMIENEPLRRSKKGTVLQQNQKKRANTGDKNTGVPRRAFEMNSSPWEHGDKK
jgi:hypothetical protein